MTAEVTVADLMESVEVMREAGFQERITRTPGDPLMGLDALAAILEHDRARVAARERTDTFEANRTAVRDELGRIGTWLRRAR